MLKLHLDPRKEDLYSRFAAVEWNEHLASWCIFDPALIIAVLRSPDFAVVDYAAEYGRIAERGSARWDSLIDALRHIPLANEDRRHADLRRDFASVIAERTPGARQVAGRFLAARVPQVLRVGNDADLVRDLILPCADALFAQLLGTAPPPLSAPGPSASQIFDRILGLNRRKRIGAEVSRIRDYCERNRDDLAVPVEYGAPLIILGYDSLVGSLGSSLVWLFEREAGRRLDAIDYPDSLPETGVPYLERVVRTGCDIGGHRFETGERVRLHLDACPARASSEAPAPYFGKGRHLCLGRELSQWLWRALVHEFSALSATVRITETALRRNDYVFRYYDRIAISVSR